jgi:hypothetical protein
VVRVVAVAQGAKEAETATSPFVDVLLATQVLDGPQPLITHWVGAIQRACHWHWVVVVKAAELEVLGISTLAAVHTADWKT